jgi:hypothetical protein
VADNGRRRGRSGADEALLSALAIGRTALEAADLVGVGERTVRRRLADPVFSGRLSQARSELLVVATARASAHATYAVDTLVELMTSTVPPAVRLGAAKAVIEFGIRLRSEADLSERLGAIEDHLGLTHG